MRIAFVAFSTVVFSTLALTACGHPATQKECEEIAERVTALELEQSGVGKDPETVKAELEKTRTWVRQTTLKDCVGKRITDRAMACVRKADTAQEIVDGCFK
jgi:hypothetical protein